MEIIFILLGLLIGGFIGYFYSKNKLSIQLNELDKAQAIHQEKYLQAEIDKNNYFSELKEEREKSEKLNSRISKAEVEFSNLREKLENQKKETEELQTKFKTDFEFIAAKILKENTREFTETNQRNMSEILLPLKDKIEHFEKKVGDTYEKGIKDQSDLKAELKKLFDLSAKISEEANNLTNALKGDVKKQGNWGEMILERILERSGLIKGEEYITQFSTQNAEGQTIQPDVIIKLPDNKHIIIDAKVSLIAFERYVSATNDLEKERFLKDHISSIKSHIKGLGTKNYQTGQWLNTPDFVLLFIPIESSFSLAIQTDLELFNLAWSNKIVMVSPSTLLATLKTIESIWKHDKQTKNAIEIARQSGALYDKFVSFISDMEKIERGLDSAKGAYSSAMGKLTEGKDNLIKKSEKIKELGAKTSKNIPDKFLDTMDELTSSMTEKQDDDK